MQRQKQYMTESFESNNIEIEDRGNGEMEIISERGGYFLEYFDRYLTAAASLQAFRRSALFPA